METKRRRLQRATLKLICGYWAGKQIKAFQSITGKKKKPPFNYKHITVKSTEDDKQLTLIQLTVFMEWNGMEWKCLLPFYL